MPRVVALADRGLAGDVHARPASRRSVLLVDIRTLEALGLAPGELREQVTVDFPGLDELREGTMLLVGEAVLEVTGPCEPCRHIGELLGVGDPERLRRALVGRRGVLARVRSVQEHGRIRTGDPVRVSGAAGSPPPPQQCVG
jgi:MOSC domain-containing protein YiiM